MEFSDVKETWAEGRFDYGRIDWNWAGDRRAVRQKRCPRCFAARNAERLDSVATSICKSGGTATAFPIDLADSDAIRQLSARITSDIGTPDVLINNAGAGPWLPFDVTTVEEAGTMLAVPYLAAFAITHAFLPDMIARGSGSAVFISSPLSYLAWPNTSAYTASRRALTGLAETLQTELEGKGISVTLVVLGAVDSPYWEHYPGMREYLPPTNQMLVPTLTLEQAAHRRRHRPEAVLRGEASDPSRNVRAQCVVPAFRCAPAPRAPSEGLPRSSS
jgi:short-subunit dehydrogenase